MPCAVRGVQAGRAGPEDELHRAREGVLGAKQAAEAWQEVPPVGAVVGRVAEQVVQVLVAGHKRHGVAPAPASGGVGAGQEVHFCVHLVFFRCVVILKAQLYSALMLPSKIFNPIVFILAAVVVAFVCVSVALYSVSTPALPTMFPYIARTNCPRPVTHGGPEVVVFIPTPIQWSDRRKRVLKQFRREMRLFRNVHLMFVVGTRDGGLLEFEAPEITGMHHEIAMQAQRPHIQYLLTECRDMGDEPRNANGTSSTTCKVYEALRHITTVYEKTPPRFVWRGADDAYVDLGVFRKYVAPALQTCRLFAGRMRFPTVGGEPDLELSTEHPELYSLYGLEKFGKYLVGMSFYMSWDVALFIGQSQIPPRHTWCEDIMVSHWLLFYDIDIVDIHMAIPLVHMIHADGEMASWSNTEHKVLVAHRMNEAQWRALHHRPVGSESTRYLLAH
jgi:hypothetical protein